MFCSGPLAGHTTSDILLSVEEVNHEPFGVFFGGVVLRANLFRGRYLILTDCGFHPQHPQQSLRSAGIGVVWMMTSSAPERCEYTAAASVLTSQNCGLDSFIG